MKNYNEIHDIIELLNQKYPAPRTELNFSTPFELLIATILSAQSTDKQVNKVTSSLFQKYNRPEDFKDLSEEELAKMISSIGLNRSKSRYIIKTSLLIIDNYDGKVPLTRKELIKLPGVGRKTANVVLACAFGKNAFPVDTHVFRVSNRLGLAESDQVKEVEKQLMKIVPEDLWIDMHHWLIFHGRETCQARKPECSRCFLSPYCKFYSED